MVISSRTRGSSTEKGRQLLLHVADLLVQNLQHSEVVEEDGVVHESEAQLPHPRDGLLAELGRVGHPEAVLVEEGARDEDHGRRETLFSELNVILIVNRI